MTKGIIAGLAALLALTGCGGAIKVSHLGPTMDPRPDDCVVDFFEDPPQRPYVELADMTTKVVAVPAAGSALLRSASRTEVAEPYLRQKACHLGADAVIVTRVTIINENEQMVISGRAIQYVPSAAAEGEAISPSP